MKKAYVVRISDFIPFSESPCPQVVIGHLDADNQDNRPVAERYDVKGYPTLKVCMICG